MASAASSADSVSESMESWKQSLQNVEDALMSLSHSRNSIANEVSHLSTLVDKCNNNVEESIATQAAETKLLWKEIVSSFSYV